MPDYETWFLGCQNVPGSGRLGTAIAQPFSGREFVYSVGSFEWFKFANRDPNFPPEFRALMQLLRPDIVHFHHFINFGVEVFRHVREALPDAKIVLTVHEYLAICHHYGQMVTRKHQNLCYASSLMRCHQCFPDISPSDFFLRQLYIQNFFGYVDRFISPSHFLAERLVAWGIPERQVSVIENVIPHPVALRTTAVQDQDGPLRIGFFGQISRLKGINVLFDAAQALESEGIEDIVFDIHGDYRGQPPEFQEDFLKRLEGASRNVKFHGPYRAGPCRSAHAPGRSHRHPLDLVGELAGRHTGSVPQPPAGGAFRHRRHGRENSRRAGWLAVSGRQPGRAGRAAEAAVRQPPTDSRGIGHDAPAADRAGDPRCPYRAVPGSRHAGPAGP